MDKYTVTRMVPVPKNRFDMSHVNISVTVDQEKLGVVLTEYYRDHGEGEDNEYSLIWEDLDDVEKLSDIFATERVVVFKNLVEMLGDFQRKKAAVMVMLSA